MKNGLSVWAIAVIFALISVVAVGASEKFSPAGNSAANSCCDNGGSACCDNGGSSCCDK